MKCKNCGADITPDTLVCPVCNTIVNNNDDLSLPDIPADDLSLPTLPDDIGTPVSEEALENKIRTDQENILKIVPIEPPKVPEGYKDELLPLDKEVETVNKVSKIDKIMPKAEDKGNDKIFIYSGIFVLVVGFLFFIYITFINKDFIDNLTKEPDIEESIPTVENENVKKESITIKELDKYIKNDATKKEVVEMFNYKKTLTKSLLHYIEEDEYELILYKKEKDSNTILKDYDSVIEKMGNDLNEDSTYTININDKDDTLIITVKENKEDFKDETNNNLNNNNNENLSTDETNNNINNINDDLNN